MKNQIKKKCFVAWVRCASSIWKWTRAQGIYESQRTIREDEHRYLICHRVATALWDPLSTAKKILSSRKMRPLTILSLYTLGEGYFTSNIFLKSYRYFTKLWQKIWIGFTDFSISDSYNPGSEVCWYTCNLQIFGMNILNAWISSITERVQEYLTKRWPWTCCARPCSLS